MSDACPLPPSSPDPPPPPAAPPGGDNGQPGDQLFFDFAPTDVTSIPDVAAFVTAVRTGMRPVVMNQNITRGYAQFARVFQGIVDPAFAASGTPPRSSRCPNWFAIAVHASHTAGKGMITTEFARTLLDVVEGEGPIDPEEALATAGLKGTSTLAQELLSNAARTAGVPGQASLVVSALATSGNFAVMDDPRTLVITTSRVMELLEQAPGEDAAHKAEAIVDTLQRTLASGNIAIFGDIGGAAQEYLLFRRTAGEPDPQAVLGGFVLGESSPADARRAYAFALEHLDDRPPPTDFEQLLPGMDSRCLVTAAFALLETVRALPEPERKERAIAFANNYLAFREQYHSVQPSFDPPERLEGEVDRAETMHAFTPPLQLIMGDVVWNFSDWAARQPDRDGSFLTSRATEYNWARFRDRWPALLDTFELGYRHRESVWRFPRPTLPPTPRPRRPTR